jgi:arylsulfatase A-like enzyme
LFNQPENETSEPPAFIVIVIDGLNAPMLGPYGNTTVETPSLNRLGAESILFDFALVNSPTLESFYQTCWNSDFEFGPSLLVSDDKTVCQAGESHFDRIVPVEPVAPTKLAEESSVTQAARFFVESLQVIDSVEPGDLCWLHCQGLAGPWDAPYEMRQSFADEEDPDPPTFSARPIADFDASVDDPDELLGYQQAAYAQVSMLDDFLRLLLDRIDANPTLKKAGLILTSPRGYPLGEHGAVGKWNDLFSESIHVPFFFRPPSFEPFAGHRNQWLVQTAQIPDMIQRCLNGESVVEETQLPWPLDAEDSQEIETDENETDFVYSTVGDQQCLQTPDWKLIVSRKPEEVEVVKLFSKPDDRWEVNDVSRRCPQVVEELLDAMQELKSNG